MTRKNVIMPEILNILCNDPLRHAHQRTAFEPQPAPEPEKKSFWDRIRGKVERACNKIMGFFEKVAEIAAPITTAIVAVTTLFKAGAKLKNTTRKKRRRCTRKKLRKTQPQYVEIIFVAKAA